MPNSTARLSGLRRPRLLISAARIGLNDYRRTRDLKRLFGAVPQPSAAATLSRLLDAEEALEADRRAGSATYSPARHVDLLIALMAESRLQPQTGI